MFFCMQDLAEGICSGRLLSSLTCAEAPPLFTDNFFEECDFTHDNDDADPSEALESSERAESVSESSDDEVPVHVWKQPWEPSTSPRVLGPALERRHQRFEGPADGPLGPVALNGRGSAHELASEAPVEAFVLDADFDYEVL
jgi:hypothetical protein